MRYLHLLLGSGLAALWCLLATLLSAGRVGGMTLSDRASHSDRVLSRKLPDALIIGAKKCGTRALLKFIGAHGNVSAANAEVHFFDRFYSMGLDWYRDQMPLSTHSQLTIEKTPKYLVDAHVPERVYRMSPRTKLIVVVRDPVTRAISEFVQSQWRNRRQVAMHEEAALLNKNAFASKSELELFLSLKRKLSMRMNDSERLESMLYNRQPQQQQQQQLSVNSDEGGGSKRTIRADWAIVRNGMYYTHIKRWLEYFPLSNFLFVNGEQLIREPSVELDRVQTFLGLRNLIHKEHFIYSKRKGFPCIVKPLNSKQVRCLGNQKGRKHPAISARIMQDLRDFYRPYDKQLFELIGEQQPWWPVD